MTIHEYNTRLDESRLPILAESRKYAIDGRKTYTSPSLIAELAGDVIGLRDAAEEYCYGIAFDTKCRIIGLFECGHGSVNASIFDVRGLYQKALMLGAASIAVVHNHPSGEPSPSRDDITVTERIKSAGEVLGVAFLDHVIIGYPRCYSFKMQSEF